MFAAEILKGRLSEMLHVGRGRGIVETVGAARVGAGARLGLVRVCVVGTATKRGIIGMNVRTRILMEDRRILVD